MKYPQFKVRVDCMTFNHSKYIKDAMNGFTMQQTDFPFVCTIVDDASTDGEQDVIRKYVEEHFDLSIDGVSYERETDYAHIIYAQHKTNKNCFFVVLFLKENHYSQNKDKYSYLKEWQDIVDHIAFCEGDDYWIDSSKLACQVSILEKNKKISMVCNKTYMFSEKEQRMSGEVKCRNKDGALAVKDIILKGGLYISTCSIVLRKGVFEYYYKKDYCINCHVGDYPLAILSALSGIVHYINHHMSVYRTDNYNSWVGKNQVLSKDAFPGIMSEVKMLYGFSDDYPTYKKYFIQRSHSYLLSFINIDYDKDVVKSYYSTFYKYLSTGSKLMIYLIISNKITLYRILNKLRFYFPKCF